ncbi:hypothetical protein [Janthinobacterium sp. MDT1-19]|uniref:hypothetical protein n=1 Tax=Janthinobacterium sp. MDT1-19 TaxID=1259339 RepID=UPI003F2698CA
MNISFVINLYNIMLFHGYYCLFLPPDQSQSRKSHGAQEQWWQSGEECRNRKIPPAPGAAATPAKLVQFLMLAMPFAAGAPAPLQQGQACAQAVTFNHAVAVRGIAVAPRQHAVGAG